MFGPFFVSVSIHRILSGLIFDESTGLLLHRKSNSRARNIRKKRDVLYDGLKDKFELIKPGGAFYAFVKAPGGSATQFVEKAIKNNVLIIPGNVFSEKDTHFRISYATSNDKIRQGIEILNKLAQEVENSAK